MSRHTEADLPHHDPHTPFKENGDWWWFDCNDVLHGPFFVHAYARERSIEYECLSNDHSCEKYRDQARRNMTFSDFLRDAARGVSKPY